MGERIMVNGRELNFNDLPPEPKEEYAVSVDGLGHSQDEAVPRAIETLRRHGLKPWRFMFYVLVGFNTTREYDLHRIYALRDMGANPFVMPYDKSDRYQKDLARWCNNKVIFGSTPRFEDYENQRKAKRR